MTKQVNRKPKTEQNPHEIEVARKRDAMALARLIYKMWKEEKRNGKVK